MTKKYFTSLFILLCSLLIIPACVKAKTNDNRTTIRFVTFKPDQPEVWSKAIRIFEKENPDIRIDREFAPHSTTTFHDLLTQKLKNRSSDVDVFFMDVIWPPEFAAAGWAEPLDSYIDKNEINKFLKNTIDANIYKNRLYGIPLFTDAGLLYYRKDLLEKYNLSPPETWKELTESAESIMVQEGNSGNRIFGFSGQFRQYEGLVCNMMEYILTNGSEIINSKSGRSALAEKKSIDAVHFVRDNIINKLSPPGVLAYQEQESLDIFIQGKSVFHRNWPYAWEVSNNPIRSRIAGKVGIIKIPHFSGKKSFSALGGWQLGLSSFSKHKKEAWKFINFMTGKKNQKFLALNAGIPPTRKSLYDDPDILQKNPHLAKMKEVFFSSYPRPITPFYTSLSNVLQRYFSKAISNQQSNIKKEALRASSEIDKILEKK